MALVDALHQVPRKPDVQVVQILGGVGNPGAEVHAARLTSRLARLVNGKATFLPAQALSAPKHRETFSSPIPMYKKQRLSSTV